MSPSFQQQLVQERALEQANQLRRQQDPQYARTQTPEFQAMETLFNTQQKDLDQQMGDYQKQSPIYQQQKDLAGKLISYMNQSQAWKYLWLNGNHYMTLRVEREVFFLEMPLVK
jgi:hypothetical protein